MFNGLLQSENNCLSRSDRFCKSFDVCQTVCLACVTCRQFFLVRKVPIQHNVSNYETICLTETECHPKQFAKIASGKENLQSFFAKFGLCGWRLRFANGLGKLCEDKNLKRCQSSLSPCQSSLTPCPSSLTPCQSFLSPSASSLMPCQSFLKPCASFIKRCQNSLTPCGSFLNHFASSLKRCQSFLRHICLVSKLGRFTFINLCS